MAEFSISVVPTRAMDIHVGDVLAAASPIPGMPPRTCLVTEALREGTSCHFDILDAIAFEATDGEIHDARLDYDELDMLGKVVREDV